MVFYPKFAKDFYPVTRIIPVLLLVLLAVMPVSATAVLEGEIREIDPEQHRIKLTDRWYQLQENCRIYRNEGISDLPALKPIADNLYHRAAVVIDACRWVLEIKAEYRVIEGVIQEINSRGKWLILEALASPETRGSYRLSYEQQPEITEMTDGLLPGHYLIVIAGRGSIIRFLSN